MPTRGMKASALLASRSSSRLVRRCLPIHHMVRSMILRRVGHDGEGMAGFRRNSGSCKPALTFGVYGETGTRYDRRSTISRRHDEVPTPCGRSHGAPFWN
jgi:hypothetical protein